MSDFQQVTKYLDISKTSRDLTVNTKPLSISKARRIQKIPYTIVLVANVVSATPQPRFPAHIVFQYNVTVTLPVRIANYGILRTSPASFLIGNTHMCVKWRVGETVTRYRLTEANITSSQELAQLDGVPWYAGEEIPENFVIEIWRRAFNPTNPFIVIGLLQDFVIETDRYVLPADAEELTSVLATVEATEDIFSTMPEDIPTVYGENSAWITN